MAFLELVAAAQGTGPVELTVVYAVSATAAVYLGRTMWRIFRPRRRLARAGAPARKTGGCASCDKCGG